MTGPGPLDLAAAVQTVALILDGRPVRVIGITGAGDEARISKISGLELAGFLAKPFAVEALLGQLQKVLPAVPESRA